MANPKNLAWNRGSSSARKRNLEAARKANDAKHKWDDQLGDAIIKWEEQIANLESALKPWLHPKGKARIQVQIVMAVETTLHCMKQARLDAEEDDAIGYLNLNTVDKTVASIHGMKFQHIKETRRVLATEKQLIVAYRDVSKQGAASEN